MDVINSLLRAARAGNLKRVIEFIDDDLVDINATNQNGLTALHSASKEGHTRIVEELISRGANVHAKTHKGNTALHIASLAGHETVVRVLIDSGADVDAQSASGFTALYMAAQENHESIVKLLLANRANQNIATTDGFTPLAVAMQQGHEKIASVLLNNEAKGRIRFPGTTESGRSLLHIAAKKDDCAAAALLMQNNISPDLTSKSGFTALHVACHYGNENVAKLLLDRQTDVNFQAKHNITPLHVASKWGKENLVDLLLEHGAKIDATTRDGLTPLHCAARSGHDAVVEELIQHGAPISAKTRSGLAPLHMATQGDHLRSAQILLNNGAPVDDVTVDYLTALHVASHCGHVKVAKLLLNNKADPNFRALNGFTSLHIACKKNRLDVVKLLLKYGASLNTVTESGLTPLHVASFMGCVEIVIYLLENSANIEPVTVRGETPLHLATRANQIDVINVLLRYGANVSARAKESQTALHIASRLGNADIARLFIQQGIDVDAPTKDSYTALHIAAKEGHEDVVAVLLDSGANISCATRNHGFTPLHLASKYGIEGVVDLLLSYGAPVDAQGKNGVTSLHVATHYDHPNIVQLLLLNRGPRLPGASPHAMAKNGYTALHIAAKGNRLDIANALLQHGANPNAESKAGFCPLHLASQEGRTDMAALLLNNGAVVNCRAKNGITPLHLCAQEDHVNVAQLLVKRGAHLDAQTKGGFTPLHVASHFARIKMIRFLLANGANVNIPAASGYTPLHQASQQGNPQIVELLLQYNAKPDALTENGQTALSIAQNLGYVSIIDTLKVVTETVVKTTTMTITEEKFKIIAPETMQETFVSDSEDEADDQAHAESVKFLTTDVMKNFNSSMADDYNTSQSNLASAGERERDREQQQQQQQQQQMQRQQQTSRPNLLVDEMQQDLTYLSREAPLDGGESTFGAATSYSQLGEAIANANREESVGNMGSEFAYDGQQSDGRQSAFSHNELALEQLAPDNVDIQRLPMQQAGNQADEEEGKLQLKPFLVSFMVDARGGAMRGCRHSGVRVIIPPNSAQMPTRITCRYLRRERLVHPPPLMEGEACASKIMEVGPAGAKFLGPVLIEVPHFASLRGKEREIIILRSDSGDVWREHLVEADEKLVESIIQSAKGNETDLLEQQENLGSVGRINNSINEQQADKAKRLTRIVTNEFPQYFAIISRIRQEVNPVGPEGSTVDSQVVPRVQAIFTEGALTKRIKIGLQPKSSKQTTNHQQQDSNENQQQQPDSLLSQQSDQDNLLRSSSPTNQPSSLTSNANERPQSAQSQTGRPNSAAGKRRSRFLACFGAGPGSIDLLTTEESSSSAGGDSPRQPCNEKLVERRRILGDVVDSDGDTRSSHSSSLHGETSAKSRVKRKASVELVPEDYYMEKEPPLILNVEPKTYGKRLASSSAQTDNKLNVNGFMSISTKKSGKRSRGLLRVRRKNKTQLNIRCDAPKLLNKESQIGDSSLETTNGDDLDTSSIIQDVITSDDQRWRTCTIQTDSDSVTVNYVTGALIDDEPSALKSVGTTTASGQDDGYVSGSGDLNKQIKTGTKTVEVKLATNEKAKRSKGKKQEKGKKQKVTVEEVLPEASQIEGDISKTPDDEQQEESLIVGQGEVVDASLATNDDSTTRSMSPTSREMKQKLKNERKEQLKREKEEKRRLKEIEEAQAKAEKAKKKAEKEAAKKAQKEGKKGSSTSPSSSKPQTPIPSEGQQPVAAAAKTSNTVKFASNLVETSLPIDSEESNQKIDLYNEKQPVQQLDSIQRVIESTNSSYEREKERLSQEDGHDMVRVSISGAPDSLEGETDKLLDVDEDKLISFSESSELSKSNEQEVPIATGSTDLKSILKQQSSEEAAVELTISEERQAAAQALVIEADLAAVEKADKLKAAAVAETETSFSELTSSAGDSKKEASKKAKEEKARLKREAKEKAEEDKLKAKEAKRLAKQAEEVEKLKKIEAKKAAKEAERLAKEAKKVAKEEAKKSKASPTSAKVEPSAPLETEALVQSIEIEAVSKNDSISEPLTSSEPVLEKPSESVPLETGVDQQGLAQVSTTSTSELASKSEGTEKMHKKVKTKKAKKMKEPKPLASETSEASELTEPKSSASKSSFLGRLFGGKKSAKSEEESKTTVTDESSGEKKVDQQVVESPKEEKPIILSEMYPSDPDDEDGEMILEVNVPQSLITDSYAGAQSSVANDESQTSDTLASPTQATTIDETLEMTATRIDEEMAKFKRSVSIGGTSQTEQMQTHEQVADDQATLVNVSQLVTSEALGEEDDDEATENVVSQANDLAQEIVESASVCISAPQDTLNEPEQVSGGSSKQQETGEGQVVDVCKMEEAKKGKKSKLELKEEKTKKELEDKVDKEAKKRAKEEEKAKKRQAKEEELRLKAEAKMRAKEEKEEKKAKEKEAKKLAELAKKEKKSKKKMTKVEESASTSAAVSGAPEIANLESSEEKQVDTLDTSTMTPVNEETEVQRIVEEVVGEDGVVTKTTKTIETKYVTLRQEEVRMSEHREMPIEEYERQLKEAEEEQQVIVVDDADDRLQEQQVKERRLVKIEIAPYEHPELDAIRATPSYFGPDCPEINELPAETSPKKVLQKRIKLNQKLIKRALKLAKSEKNKAKKSAERAQAEIAVCDEAAKEARKRLKHALKESKRASKEAQKAHKKMDKVDKKLAKRQKKIEKRQKKLDKKAAKLAKKESKKREKLAKKETTKAKSLERKSSSRSSSPKKTFKLEDIGEPMLKSSSRLSIGHLSEQVINEQPVIVNVNGARASPASDDIQVELSLDDNHHEQQQSHHLEQSTEGQPPIDLTTRDFEEEITHTILTETTTEFPDGQVVRQVNEQILNGLEAREASRSMDHEEGEEMRDDNSEIDVVNDDDAVVEHGDEQQEKIQLAGS